MGKLSLGFIIALMIMISAEGTSSYGVTTCELLLGTGPLRIVIVPAAFDGSIPEEVEHFERVSDAIAFDGFGAVSPYKTNTDRYSVLTANDYRGKT